MGQALEAWKSCRAGRLVNGAEAGSGCGRPRRRLRGDNGSYSLGARGGATAQIAVAGRPRLDLRFIPAAALKASPTGADRDPHNGLIWSPFSGLVRENRGFQERGFVVPRSYAPEFRRRVVELVRLGRAVSVVAAEIGVSEATVYRWRERQTEGGAAANNPGRPQHALVAAAAQQQLQPATFLNARIRRCHDLIVRALAAPAAVREAVSCVFPGAAGRLDHPLQRQVVDHDNCRPSSTPPSQTVSTMPTARWS